MTEKKDGGSPTSGNREESMEEAGEDAFGRGSVRKPDPTDQSDGSSDDEAKKRAARSGVQSSGSSGTESLGGETQGSADIKGPGGVEGEGGSS